MSTRACACTRVCKHAPRCACNACDICAIECCRAACRFDYLPHTRMAASMAAYTPAGAPAALLALPYVSPVNLPSLQGLAGRWLVLSGGAELLRHDIDRSAASTQRHY